MEVHHAISFLGDGRPRLPPGAGIVWPLKRLRTRQVGRVVFAYPLVMDEAPSSTAITIRPTLPQDADSITRIYLESADYHASLDPERYWVPEVEAIAARYREGRQHPPGAGGEALTLVAELGGDIAGFVDARITHSPDPMHREMIYCHVVEIAVRRRHQGQGVGGRLLRAAEDWGREQGAELASLEYLAANTRASAFYQRSGYRAAAITAIKRL
jgi:ribosomal protein S18 acetylase RimI-like enzyme